MTSRTATLDQWAEQFSTHRRKLFAIAHRTLGSPWAADDAVQEVWLRLQNADRAGIHHLEAWLTTVVSRVCIDMIRSQSSRHEDLRDEPRPEPEPEGATLTDGSAGTARTADPVDEVMIADDLALAMQIVLETLGPLERLSLVLHDVFALSFADIAPILDRTPVAARQLASRARARLRTVDVPAVRSRQEEAISAFLEAARGGDFGRILQLLDPDIELRSDEAAVALATAGAEHGAPLLAADVRGADAVARVFAGRAELTRPVVIDGVPAAAYVTDGTPHAVYLVTIDSGRIVRLDVLADPGSLASWTTSVLPPPATPAAPATQS